MKKIFTTLFILSLIVSPSVSNAGFFDFFRINQTAQVKNVSTINSNIVGYRKGDRAEVITQVQKALFDKGLYKGDISGLIGPKTEASIKSWQQANRLPVTGILDAETINSILGRSGDDNRGGGNPNSTTAQANCAPGDMPWIKVKKPNGGETYVAGENVKVRWESCNVSSTSLVYINIETSNVGQSLSTPVISGTVNDGIEQITIPTGFTPGPYYVQVYTPAPDYNADFSDDSFMIGNQIGGGNCDEDEVDLSILPTTPFGVQTNTNDFPVLEFKVENSTDCDVQLDSMKFIYMVTDTLPYFEDITLREKDTLLNVGMGEANTGISGEFLSLGFGQNGYVIGAGDEQDFLLVLEGYDQPTQGQLPYIEFINKSMLFGLPKYNSLNFRFMTDMIPHIIQLPVNVWGKVVQLPL